MGVFRGLSIVLMDSSFESGRKVMGLFEWTRSSGGFVGQHGNETESPMFLIFKGI